ncbi:MAG TPA: transglycosylase domain-containing protein [Ktedonobacteraceae bacterium]|nr:transglycosylase domain-containing protein [Ktedonobacteraceae bacterium]
MDNYDGQQHDDSLEKDPPASREEQDLTNRTQHLSEDRQTPDPAARHRVSSHLPVPVSRDQPARGTARRTRRAHLSRLNRRLIHERVHRRTRRRRQFARRVVTSMAVIFATILVVLSGSIGAAYAYYQSQLPMLNGIANHTMFQTTRIYDRNGNLLYEINDPNYGRRTYVNYNDISPLLINATIAAEDHTFWTNNGVDFQGIVRAAITDVQSQQTVEGASTITQQLIKWQFFLNDSRSLQVKAEEAILAYGITQQLPKWKIMEMYLNVIYYGELNYGAEAAAEDYFGLQPKCSQHHCIPAVGQLDLAQASMLAGLPQSPSYYDPILNKPAAMQRQKTVLDAMVQLHMITAQQEQQAIQETQKFNFKSYVNPDAIQAPHFVQYVIDDVLVPLLGAQNLYTGGYNIYTTLDLNLEKKVEQIAYYRLYQDPCPQYLGCLGPLYKSHNVNDAAVVVMDPFNGEILAMDGSASYNNTSKKVDGQFNAALALRQPGSSIKPVVYATAFEMGLYPAMVFPNHLTIYPTPDSGSPYGYYAPQDYGGVFLNDFPQTIRNDLANSLNVPAVDAIEYTGIPNVLNMAARLGLTSISSLPPSKLGPSMALGSEAVSLLSLTDAYATFANQGVRVAPTSILEITNNQGQVLYSYDASHPHGVRAVSPEVAFLISSMLSDKAARYHEFAPGNPLELDRPAAAKTGTSDTFIDNWTMGYTPHITVGVWVGNADNSPMDNNVIGITGAGPIWHDVMEYVSNYYHFPADDFIRPADVQEGTVSANTGLLAQPGEPTVTDWFIDGTMPTVHDQYTPPSHRRHCFIFCPPGGGNQGG